MATKKDLLLGRSRALVGGNKLLSLSDFQETPTGQAQPLPAAVTEPEPAAAAVPAEAVPRPLYKQSVPVLAGRPQPSRGGSGDAPPLGPVQTRTYVDVQRRTKVAVKVVRENFRFTVELADALEQCADEKRLKKNTIVEIALEQYLHHEGYL